MITFSGGMIGLFAIVLVVLLVLLLFGRKDRSGQ